MVTDTRGHEVPADSDPWGYREDMGLLSASISDVRSVADQAAADALLADLVADDVDPAGTVCWLQSPGQLAAYDGTTWQALPSETDLAGRIVTYLAENANTATDTSTAYPMGLSVMPMSAAGWPVTSGLVVTQRFSTDLIQQFLYTTLSRGFYRSGGSGGWASTGWVSLTAPFGQAAGTATVTGVRSESGKSTSVSFPSGRFTKAPFITLGLYTTSPAGRDAAHMNKSATGFTMYAYNAWSSTTDILVSWHAFQLSDTSTSLLAEPMLMARAGTPATATVTCPTTGCENQGMPIELPSTWTDEETGQIHDVDAFQCGVCGADITDTLQETS